MSSTSESPGVSAPAASVAQPLEYASRGAASPRKIGLLSVEAWKPMQYPIFAWLWVATLLNYVGTAARDVMGSPWLMRNLTEAHPHQQPVMVGLVTVASTLPLALLSVFAGTLADLFDRRQLLIFTQLWMVAISMLLSICTWVGWISPWGLLALTILLAIGTAASNPAFQAVLPELVPPTDISLAMGLNSVALNLARAAGPALFMIAMAIWKGRRGIAASYMFIAFTFVAVTVVLLFWNRPVERAAVKGERFWGALRSGLQYTVHSRSNLAILYRVLTFIVPSLALWSQLPILAKQVNVGATGFSVLMICLGGGAVFGVFMMQELQRRFSIDGAVNGCTLMFAIGLIVLSQLHTAWLADLVMFFLGINWVIIPTNFNVATQVSVPPWVKGRALSMYLTVLWGSFAIGGTIWGNVTAATNLPTSLFLAGVIMAALLLTAKWFPLTLSAGEKLAPAIKPGQATSDLAGLPLASLESTAERTGPVQIAVRYHLDPASETSFLNLARRVGKQRLRNGATHWSLRRAASENETGQGVAYIEQFRFHSAAECVRQPARLTISDLELLKELRQLHVAAEPPHIAIEDCPPDERAQVLAELAKEHAFHALDRILEELEISYRRLSRSR